MTRKYMLSAPTLVKYSLQFMPHGQYILFDNIQDISLCTNSAFFLSHLLTVWSRIINFCTDFKTLFLNKICGSCRELVSKKKLVGSGLSPQATLNSIYLLMWMVHGNLHMCNSSIFKVTSLHRMMNLKFRKRNHGNLKSPRKYLLSSSYYVFPHASRKLNFIQSHYNKCSIYILLSSHSMRSLKEMRKW